jgi:HAD superfamily hydrolase (TIGR01484 family)
MIPDAKENKMIKLLVVDLDGTLLKNHRSISKVNKKALKAAADKGIPIAVCTGRNHRLTIGIVKRLKLPVYYCCVGGTEIYNSDDELIKTGYLDSDSIRQVLSIIKDESCLIQITKQDGYFKYATDVAAK